MANAKTAKDRAAQRRAAMRATTMPAGPSEELAPAESPAAPAGVAAPLNAKPVRTTVVLSPVEYDGLQDFCAEVQRETGRRGVAGSEVMRMLLGLLLDDDGGLKHKVSTMIEKQGGNRRR